MTHKQYNYLKHEGVKGQVHGIRQYQYEDGNLTPLGRVHYGVGPPRNAAWEERRMAKWRKNMQTKARQNLLESGQVDKVVAKNKKYSFSDEEVAYARAKSDQVNRLKQEEAVEKVNKLADKRKKEIEKAIKTGDVETVLKNQEYLTNEQVNDALKRATQRRNLEDEVYKEDVRKAKKEGLTGIISNTLDKLEGTADVAMKGAEFYSKIRRAKSIIADVDADEKLSKMSVTDALKDSNNMNLNTLKVLANRLESFNKVREVGNGLVDTEKYDINDVIANPNKYTTQTLSSILNKSKLGNSIKNAIEGKTEGSESGGGKKFNISAMQPKELAAVFPYLNEDQRKEAIKVMGDYKALSDKTPKEGGKGGKGGSGVADDSSVKDFSTIEAAREAVKSVAEIALSDPSLDDAGRKALDEAIKKAFST